MKKFLVLLLFLLQGIFLLAQPHIETITTGIKFVKIQTCGYSKYGDSTGLKVIERREYNLKGQLTKNIKLNEVPMDIGYDPEEERQAESFFYLGQEHSPFGSPFDTLKYYYNGQGQLVKRTELDYEGKPMKTVFTYDATGLCISEVFSRSGKEEHRTDWKYNAHGDLLTEWKKKPGLPAKKTKEFNYDAQNRLIQKMAYGYFADSLIYTYSTTGRLEQDYRGAGVLYEKMYDAKDSLIYHGYFSQEKRKNGERTLVIKDSTSIRRDANGLRVSSYTVSRYGSRVDVITQRFDAKGRCIEALTNRDGENVRKLTYEYNDSLHTTTAKRYGIYHDKTQPDSYGKERLMEVNLWMYDAKNHLLEERKSDGYGELLERTIYTYAYY